jgi:hypothetical protein
MIRRSLLAAGLAAALLVLATADDDGAMATAQRRIKLR